MLVSFFHGACRNRRVRAGRRREFVAGFLQIVQLARTMARFDRRRGGTSAVSATAAVANSRATFARARHVVCISSRPSGSLNVARWPSVFAHPSDAGAPLQNRAPHQILSKGNA